MNNIKTFLVAAALLAIKSVPAYACPGEGKGGNWSPASQIEKTLGTGALALSAKQKADLESIFSKAREKCKDQPKGDAKHECFKGIRQGVRSQMDAVLTEPQRKALKAAREARREKWHDEMSK